MPASPNTAPRPALKPEPKSPPAEPARPSRPDAPPPLPPVAACSAVPAMLPPPPAPATLAYTCMTSGFSVASYTAESKAFLSVSPIFCAALPPSVAQLVNTSRAMRSVSSQPRLRSAVISFSISSCDSLMEPCTLRAACLRSSALCFLYSSNCSSSRFLSSSLMAIRSRMTAWLSSLAASSSATASLERPRRSMYSCWLVVSCCSFSSPVPRLATYFRRDSSAAMLAFSIAAMALASASRLAFMAGCLALSSVTSCTYSVRLMLPFSRMRPNRPSCSS